MATETEELGRLVGSESIRACERRVDQTPELKRCVLRLCDIRNTLVLSALSRHLEVRQKDTPWTANVYDVLLFHRFPLLLRLVLLTH